MINQVTINSKIINAAALIADIDPDLAKVFIDQPFNRHTLVTAFHRGLLSSYYAPIADEIAVALRSAIDSVSFEGSN